MDEQTKKIINKCLIKIKNGNKKYVDVLYYLIAHKLKFIALKYLRNEEEAKDVEQSFWADIYKNAKNFKYADNGYSYLCRIMKCMSVNRYNQIQTERHHTVEDIETSLIDPFDEDTYIDKLDNRIAVQKALDNLEPKERAIMYLIVYDDKTIEQVAKDLKMSKSKVGRIKLVAEEKLKNELSAMGLGKKSELD